jgi:hypothetical protein
MRNFDLVQFLLALAGRVQARRNDKAKAKVLAYRAAIQAATEGLQAAELSRKATHKADLTVVV